MQNNIPLPTDNIYKFYALFGLLLFVFSVGSIVYINKQTNNEIVSIANEIDMIDINKSNSNMYPILQKKLDVIISDRKIFQFILSAFAVIGGIMAFYGFSEWHTKIQPKQDKILDLEIEKSILELEILKNKINKSDDN